MERWLRNPNVVRVIALVLGILLWAVVHIEDRSLFGSGGNGVKEQQITNVVVTPRFDSDKYFLELLDPPHVTVSMMGKESALKKAMASNTYTVEADLNKLAKGDHVVTLVPQGFPDNVTVKVLPMHARVVLDEKSNKQMPITVNVTGIPAVGLKAGQPIVKPNKVTVTVPSALTDEVDTVRADVNVEKAQSAVSTRARLTAHDKEGRIIDQAVINPPVVEVEVSITSPFTTVPLQLKQVGETPRGLSVGSLTLSSDKVTVFGPQDVLNRLAYYEGPALNLSNMKEEREYNVTLDIPLRNHVTQIEPNRVEVKVVTVPSTTKVIEQVPISIIGQNDTVDTRIKVPNPAKVSVVLEGAPAIMDHLKAADIQLIADVSNLPPGVFEVQLTNNLPPFVKMISMNPSKVFVEIKGRQ